METLDEFFGCRKVTGRLSDFLDKDFNPRTMREIGEHLDVCVACRHFYDSLDYVVKTLRTDPSSSLSEEEVEDMMRTLHRAYQDAVEELKTRKLQS